MTQKGCLKKVTQQRTRAFCEDEPRKLIPYRLEKCDYIFLRRIGLQETHASDDVLLSNTLA